MKLNLNKFISQNLKNIKVKHVIIIILIIFFIIVVTKKYYENFEECTNHVEPALSQDIDTLPEICPYPSPSPICTVFEAQVRSRRQRQRQQGSSDRNGVNLILEFNYNDNCSIAREFLYGCCQDFEDPIKHTFPSSSKYMERNGNNEDSYSKNTGIGFTTPSSKTIYKNSNYRENDSCGKIDYYQDSTGKNICYPKSQDETTFSNIMDLINGFNEYFYSGNITLNIDSSAIYNDNFVTEKKLPEINYEEHPHFSGFQDVINFFNPQIKFKLNKTFDETIKIPSLVLKISNKSNPSENDIIYKKDYQGNLNNFCGIAEFLYSNFKIKTEEMPNNPAETGTTPTQLYQMTIDIGNGRFTKSIKNFSITSVDEIEYIINDNLILKVYQDFGKSCPSAKIHFILSNKFDRNEEIRRKKDVEEENYVESRPKIYWENINPLKVSNNENVEVKYLFLMLVDREIKEEYVYGNGNDNDKNLIYWFAWNINKNNFNIPQLNKSDVIQENLNAEFKQFYPYKLFNPNTLQLPSYDKNNQVSNIRINRSLGADRMAKLKFQYILLTEAENEILNNTYKDLKNDNFSELYSKFFEIMNENNLTPTTCSPEQDIDLVYSMPGRDNLNKYKKFLLQDEIYRNNQLRLFSYDNISYEISENNFEKTIQLPKNTYWKLTFTNNNNNPYLCKINNREMAIINNDKNYLYLPFKTDNFKIGLTYQGTLGNKDYFIIEESQFITKPFVWENVLDNNLIKNKYFYGVITKEQFIKFNVNIMKESKVLINFLGKNINTSQINNFINKGNFTDDNLQQFSYLTNQKITQINDLKLNGNSQLELYNGTITFSVDEDIENTDINNFMPKRLNYKKIDKASCYDNNIKGSQILPSLKLKMKQTTNQSFKLDFNELYGAIEVYYHVNENNVVRKKVLYLEWDIDLSELNNETNNELDFHYNTFKINKNIRNMNNQESDSIPAPSPIPAGTDTEPFIGSIGNNQISDTNRHYFYNRNVRDYNKKCKPNQYYKNIVLSSSMKFKINENLNDDDKLRELNNINFNNKENTFEKTKDNGDKIKFIFNDSIKIWQIWEVNDLGDKNFNYIWIANQANQDYIFQVKPINWIFSPAYKKTRTEYDFFDFPNWYNKDKDIKGTSLNKVRIVKASLEPLGNREIGNSNDCSFNTVESDDINNYNINNYVPKYFRNTLFNIPSISEIDIRGEDIGVTNPTYEYQGDNSGPSISDDNLNIFYNLHLRFKFHLYKKNPESSKQYSDVIVNRFRSNQNMNLMNKYNRILSELVKDNYLNLNLSNQIRVSVNNMNLNTNKKYMFYDETLTDLLVHRGDISKNRFYRENPNSEYKPMNKKAFAGEKQTIIDRRTISQELVDNFENYIKENEVLLQNYSSYGNYGLMQNETEITYQIPIDLKCLENDKHQNRLTKGSETEIRNKINLTKLYTYGRNLNTWFNNQNVTNYFYNRDFMVKKELRHNFYETDLNTLGENIYDSLGKLITFKNEYFDVDENNNETSSANKTNIVIKMLERIPYLQQFDTGDDRRININEPLLNGGETIIVTPAPSPAIPPAPTGSESIRDTNRKMFTIYKEFYILYELYKIFEDFIKINNDNNLNERIISKMLQIKNHFDIRYRAVFNAPVIEENTEENNGKAKEGKEQPKRLPKRREMNVYESVQHYKNMIFDIFSGEENSPA
jgi:hypothetical protein